MQAFIELLLKKTSAPLYINTLKNPDNPDDSLKEHNVHTRDLDHIQSFVEKYDVSGRGVFFCVGFFAKDKKRAKKNTDEVIFLHCDIDPKDIEIPLEEAQKRLEQSKLPPSMIFSSGRGLHAYWMLKEPYREMGTYEICLKQLAFVFAGDPLVCHAAALMRLPGTHNSKNGSWNEVELLYNNLAEYSFPELSDWLSLCSPIIPKKGAENTISFQEFATKPPTDVEARLIMMKHGGEGETSVHATQLSVTASMLNAGVDKEEVVKRVLDATMAAVDEDWDWEAEEKTIEGMCDSWEEKRAAEPVAQLINLEEVRQDRAEAKSSDKKKKQSKEELYRALAIGTMTDILKSGERFLFVEQEPWRYHRNVWSRVTNTTELNAILSRKVQFHCNTKNIFTNLRMIAEIRGLIVNELIPIVHNITWNDVSGIPFQNGVLDVKTMELRSHSPDDFITRLIDREYNPDEDCPNWKQVLKDCFPEEPDVINLIQEIAGAGLLSQKPRSITTALVLVGPPMSGKSNLLEVLSSIYSSKRNSTPVDTLDKSHGTMNFLDQTPWVLDEAFDAGKWHSSATVKALLTGEPIGVNIKNGAQTNIAFRAPIFWGSNVMPQFKEMTEAIKKRLTVIRCGQIFDEDNMTQTAKTAIELGYANPADYVVCTELLGIINWAIEGLVRAITNKRFSAVSSVKEAAEMIHESGNYAIEFLRDCTILDPTKMINNSDLHGAFSVWWKENRGEGYSAPSPVALLTAIAALHRKDIVKSPERFNRHRPILGIALSDTGQDLWTAAVNEANNRGTGQRFSENVEQINKDIPSKWLHIIKKKATE